MAASATTAAVILALLVMVGMPGGTLLLQTILRTAALTPAPGPGELVLVNGVPWGVLTLDGHWVEPPAANGPEPTRTSASAPRGQPTRWTTSRHRFPTCAAV
jgi:hypothetical protein